MVESQMKIIRIKFQQKILENERWWAQIIVVIGFSQPKKWEKREILRVGLISKSFSISKTITNLMGENSERNYVLLKKHNVCTSHKFSAYFPLRYPV